MSQSFSAIEDNLITNVTTPGLLPPSTRALQDGWGNFCFKEHGSTRCYVCRKKSPPPYPLGYYDDMTIELNILFGGQVFEEEDDITREPPINPFRFLDLPLEIRSLIYNHLITPFRNTEGNISLHLNTDIKPHPFRKRHALIFYGDTQINRHIADLPYKDDDPHLHVEYEDYQALWNFASVCHQIRAEFAPLFWMHVTITCPLMMCIPGGNFDHIKEFLQYHQEAITSLKYFSWGLMLQSYTEEAQKELDNLFSGLERYLPVNVTEIVVNICVGEAVAKEVLLHPELGWVRMFRGMQKGLWLDDEMLPATREQLYELLNPKLLSEKEPVVQEEYLLGREC